MTQAPPFRYFTVKTRGVSSKVHMTFTDTLVSLCGHAKAGDAEFHILTQEEINARSFELCKVCEMSATATRSRFETDS